MARSKDKKKKTASKSKKKKTSKKVSHIRPGHDVVNVYLTVSDSNLAIDFYKKAFGAKEIGRITMPNGAIGHAEIKIGNQVIMMADENEEWGNHSPLTLKGTSVGLSIYVKNVDKAFQKALDIGARQIMPVSDQFYGDRMGTLLDPFGHKWSLSTHFKDVSFKEMQKHMDALNKE